MNVATDSSVLLPSGAQLVLLLPFDARSVAVCTPILPDLATLVEYSDLVSIEKFGIARI